MEQQQPVSRQDAENGNHGWTPINTEGNFQNEAKPL
jgi:hypothetical protein